MSTLTTEAMLRLVDEARLLALEGKRSEMIADLIERRSFSKDGAARCIDNFLATLRYCLEETGRLPE